LRAGNPNVEKRNPKGEEDAARKGREGRKGGRAKTEDWITTDGTDGADGIVESDGKRARGAEREAQGARREAQECGHPTLRISEPAPLTPRMNRRRHRGLRCMRFVKLRC
jgi:hypothetical protein